MMKRTVFWRSLAGMLLGFLLFSAWWSGCFGDVGKTIDRSYDLSGVEYPDTSSVLSAEEFLADPLEELKAQVPQMTTKAIVDTLIAYLEERITGVYAIFTPFESLYHGQLTNFSSPYEVLVHELMKRNNSANALWHRYETAPAMRESEFGEIPNDSVLGNFEILLSQPKFQAHLGGFERQNLYSLAVQKQAEKSENPAYPYALYNYLLADTHRGNNWLSQEEIEKAFFSQDIPKSGDNNDNRQYFRLDDCAVFREG